MNAPRQHHLSHPDAFFIGGEWVEPSSKTQIDVVDSATEEVFLSVAEAQSPDVARVVAAAREAFDRGPWPRMSHAERAVYLNKIADAWEKRTDAVADTWSAESGVLRAMSVTGAPMAAQVFRYYASLSETFPWQEKHRSMYGLPALLIREPVGVVAAIIPWNGPVGMVAYKAAAALIAGCTVIVKASPEAPASIYLFAEICEEVGLPAGVVNVFTADREVSEQLVRDPGVDKVSFTGSTAAGQKIGAICGDRIARCTLELGGKSPAVILDDYDLGKAAAALTQCTPMLTGQVCAALSRVIVSEKRHDEFVDALSAAFNTIKVGDPFDPESHMGPLAMDRQRERVEGYIRKGKEEGARLAAGGNRPAHLNRGFYIEPTVFANVDNRSTIAREEIFGPVISVIPAASEAQAIELANDTDFGLNSAVFTDDPERALHVARQIRAGTVGINGFKADFSIAFGGYKKSGIGREGGLEGLHPFLEVKTVVFEDAPTEAR